LSARRTTSTISAIEPWEPADDATAILSTLMEIRERLDELGEHIVAIRELLEDGEEEAED
jgi:hypothetical protein